MRTLKLLAAACMLLTVSLALSGFITIMNGTGQTASEKTVVLLRYKAQPEKGATAVSELTKLIEKVKLEPNFIEIRLHVDPKDNTNILLYEEWSDAQYYNTDHMETDHIREFIENSRNFLTGPPDITFWEVARTFR